MWIGVLWLVCGSPCGSPMWGANFAMVCYKSHCFIVSFASKFTKIGFDLAEKCYKTGKMGHTPSTVGTFRKKFWKNSGKTPETLSEHFLEFPSRARLGCPKPYDSRHLSFPEHFQNSLPTSTAGDASFFRSGSGEGLSELVMEFLAVLGVLPRESAKRTNGSIFARPPPPPVAA